MLQTLSRLGLVEDKQESDSRIRNVIGMNFKYNADGVLEYDKSETHELGDISRYLYEPIKSGKPGLFLTGNIPYQEIKELRKSKDHTGFIRRKILWFPNGKLVNSPKKLENLGHYRKKELAAIFQEMKDKAERISTDVITILTENPPVDTLLTIMIQEEKEEAMFVGEIDDYLDFFNKGKLSKKQNTNVETLTCGICNKEHQIHSYAESPLPFFYSKKLHYFENADNSNIARGFPICHECYVRVGNGIKFIKNRLDYRISTVQIGKKEQKLVESGIKFWLMPSMNNYELLNTFKNQLGDKSLYYLDSLKELCGSLHSIQKGDVEDRHDYTEAFLRFSALFYTEDKKAYSIMRVISLVHDIYPPQLRKLLDVKTQIDNQYPFQDIRGQEFFVGLPLLITFYRGIKAQWETQIISILNKMFTGQRIPTDDLIQNINVRVHQALRESYDLEIISKIVFNGLMLLEYIYSLNGYESVADSDSNIMMLNKPTYETDHTDRFIEAHKSVLDTETKRGVFASGVTVAIFFHVQEEKFDKTAPYWDKVSRLDLNLQKVKDLIYDVRKRLATDRNRKHDTIISYLATAYPIDPYDSSVPKDLTSYIFALGLSFGYLLARHNLKNGRKEEVIE